MEDAMLEKQLFALLAQQKAGGTICPSEVACALLPEGGMWQELMPGVRQVAAGLAQDGRLVITRGGVPVDATVPGGPIRLGLPLQAAERLPQSACGLPQDSNKMT